MAYSASPHSFNGTVTVTATHSYAQEGPEDKLPAQTSVPAVQLPPHIFDCAIVFTVYLSIKINAQGLEWKTFRSIIATSCSSTYNKIARLPGSSKTAPSPPLAKLTRLITSFETPGTQRYLLYWLLIWLPFPHG
ncbi:hypothetical protein MJO29_009571 [Puccinia striiformis f. sp. tritici]|nr:hypothetical protein MJO29_009571 [Puccinia striiformis f. sp. tritici]